MVCREEGLGGVDEMAHSSASRISERSEKPSVNNVPFQMFYDSL